MITKKPRKATKRKIIDEKKLKQEFKKILFGIRYVGRNF